MKRKIVIDTGALHNLKSDEKIFQIIKKAGFKHYDYSLFWIGETEHIGVDVDFRENAKKVRDLADSYGLKCVQTHGYFTFGITPEAINRRIDYLKKDIEITHILGSKVMVLHPIVEFSLDENFEFIKKYILPVAKEFKVKIAIENIFNYEDGIVRPVCTSNPKDLADLIDKFDDEYVGACVDIGHAELKELKTSAVYMIKTLDKRIYAMHIHDNNHLLDNHQMPYTQEINYSKVLNALKEIKYNGNITFEVETCYGRGEDPTASLPFELYPAFVELEYKIGKYFTNFLDK